MTPSAWRAGIDYVEVGDQLGSSAPSARGRSWRRATRRERAPCGGFNPSGIGRPVIGGQPWDHDLPERLRERHARLQHGVTAQVVPSPFPSCGPGELPSAGLTGPLGRLVGTGRARARPGLEASNFSEVPLVDAGAPRPATTPGPAPTGTPTPQPPTPSSSSLTDSQRASDPTPPPVLGVTGTPRHRCHNPVQEVTGVGASGPRTRTPIGCPQAFGPPPTVSAVERS